MSTWRWCLTSGASRADSVSWPECHPAWRFRPLPGASAMATMPTLSPAVPVAAIRLPSPISQPSARPNLPGVWRRTRPMTVVVEEIRLNLPHVELAAHLYGPEDGRPVLALHGWLDNAATFSRLAPRLQGLRIVALDFAGRGHSGHRGPGAGYQLWDYAVDVLLVAEELGWQRFLLLGHSLGGIIA